MYMEISSIALKMQADISLFLAIPNLTRYRNCLLTWKWRKITTRMIASRNDQQPKPKTIYSLNLTSSTPTEKEYSHCNTYVVLCLKPLKN